MMTFNMHRSVNKPLALILVPAMICLPIFSGLIPALRASDEPQSAAPFGAVYADYGFGGLSPQSTSANAPTQPCTNGVSTGSKSCSEQFSGEPAIDLGLGVRPIRHLEGGMTLSVRGDFSEAATQTATFQCVSGCTGTETRNIVPHSILFTTDGRLVLPLFRERLLVTAGGGIAWLQVSEAPQAVGNEQLQGCDTCQGHRGHGPTEVVELLYMPFKHIGIGFHVRNVQVSSNGLTPDSGPRPGGSITYKDRFLSIGGAVSFRFGMRH
jgi:hypothetical protein